MSKGMDRKKEAKKKPAKTAEEKRAAKREKNRTGDSKGRSVAPRRAGHGPFLVSPRGGTLCAALAREFVEN